VRRKVFAEYIELLIDVGRTAPGEQCDIVLAPCNITRKPYCRNNRGGRPGSFLLSRGADLLPVALGLLLDLLAADLTPSGSKSETRTAFPS